MSRLDSSGVLNDYSVSAQERMAFDHAPRTRAVRRLTVDAALRAAREQQAAADHVREQSPMARAVRGYNRLA